MTRSKSSSVNGRPSAARSARRPERQSTTVPKMSKVSSVGFIRLFPGRLLGGGRCLAANLDANTGLHPGPPADDDKIIRCQTGLDDPHSVVQETDLDLTLLHHLLRVDHPHIWLLGSPLQSTVVDQQRLPRLAERQ